MVRTMKLVTDNNVLSQLNGSPAPRMDSPVTDQKVLSQLDGPSSQQEHPNLLQRAGNWAQKNINEPMEEIL